MAGDEELGQLALDALAWSGDAEARTDALVAALGQRLDLADCHLYTRDDAGRSYRLQHAWTASGLARDESAASGGSTGAGAASGGAPQLQLSLDPGTPPLTGVATEVGVLHAVPLRVPGRIDAFLLVGNGRAGIGRGTRRALTRSLDVVAAVAGQLRHEAELERTLAATTARAETSRRLHGSAVDLDQFLGLLLDLAISATSSEGGFVAVAGGDLELRLRAARGLPEEVLAVDLSAGTGLFDWELASEAAPLLIRDPAQAAALGLRSLLALPLQQGTVPLGVFAVATLTRPGAFDAGSLQLLSSFADQVTLMLDNQRVFAEFTDRYLTVLEGISGAVDARRPGPARYSQVASSVAEAVAGNLGLSSDDRAALRRAGLVHDVGLAAMPSATDQYAVDVEHPAVGAGLLESVPVRPILVEAVECHHEWYDGWGFPRGLRGEEIPIGGRIMGLAAFAADMATGDPVRPGWGVDRLVEEIVTRAGSQFDPAVAEAAVALLPDHLPTTG
jgi:GAF domain-containing protein